LVCWWQQVRGEFEERLKKIMDEIRSCDFGIDEVHTIGAGAAEAQLTQRISSKPA